MRDPRRTHVVVSAPSQWGQQACDHLLNRAVANGGRVTLLVPRRDQERFEENPPSIKGWQTLPSLKAWLEQMRASDRPIDFVYDDHCNHLAAVLISQRTSGTHLTVGYVTSSAEDHLGHASYLSQLCERVLVEKPVSRISSEIEPGGESFPKLMERLAVAPPDRRCLLRTAEHYLFRPGVTTALQHGKLKEFLQRHRRCNLHYEFHFEEPAGRDDPTSRLGAYQDGSILDILAPHGLGPLACLLLSDTEREAIDFYTDLKWRQVRRWQATERRDGPLKLPVLAETAADLRGTLRLKAGNRTIHVKLQSAKGCGAYLRFFRFSCPVSTCHHIKRVRERVLSDFGTGRTAQGESPSLYFGVSLGSAGFTVLDYGSPPMLDQLFLEQDGGYKSDTRGSISEAANAQAAMLDALLAEDFESEERFVSVKTACELVRSGLRAQGAAFNQEPAEYVWGAGPWVHDSDEKEEPARLKTLPLSNLSPGLEQLKEVLGFQGQARPYHRLVTILGPEGAGNSDVARDLADSELKARRIYIPRDEDWDLPQRDATPGSPPPSRFTLEMVLRELASHLHLPLTTARRPAEELPAYLRKVGKKLAGTEILLFNGVDRLPRQDWQVLVRILNQLPTTYRMIFVTKRWDRAVGFVVRTEELMHSLPKLESLLTPPLDHYFPPAQEAQHQVLDDYQWLWEKGIIPFSKRNLTVQQQIACYVIYIALPAALRRVGVKLGRRTWWKLDPKKVPGEAVRDHIEDEIASLGLPTSLTPNPEAFLDRISMLSLAMVDEADRAAVRSLAAVSGYIPRELMDEVLPGLFDKLLELHPARALFEAVTRKPDKALLFPRVRKTVITCKPESLAQLRAEIERRRLILSLRRLRLAETDEKERRSLDEQMIRLLYGASLESLNLDGSPFEAWCMELIEGLETSSDLPHGDQAAGSLIELLTDESSISKTNLGLLARARLTRLKGWLLRSVAGTDPARLHQVTKVLDHAHALAQYCVPEEKQSKEQLDTLVLTMQARVFAGLVQGRCWHHWFGVRARPWSEDQDWESLVKPNLKASAKQNLWQLCGLDPWQDSRPERVNLSPKVHAIALRVLALHTAVRGEDPFSGRAARLCLWAAQLNDYADGAEASRARNLLEAALLLPDDKPIEDLWSLIPVGRGFTRSFLRDKANHIFDPKQAPGLAPYMELLNLILTSRLESGTRLKRSELGELEARFQRAGEVYFAELVRDMKQSFKNGR